MTATSRFVFGTVEDGSVDAWIRENAHILPSIRTLLITSLDSEPDVARLKSIEGRFGSAIELSGHEALKCSGTEIVQMSVEESLFSGFDELWIPDSEYDAASWTIRESLVGPTTLTEAPQDLMEQMIRSHIHAGIGDGTGLNFVWDRELLTQGVRFRLACRTWREPL